MREQPELLERPDPGLARLRLQRRLDLADDGGWQFQQMLAVPDPRVLRKGLTRSSRHFGVPAEQPADPVFGHVIGNAVDAGFVGRRALTLLEEPARMDRISTEQDPGGRIKAYGVPLARHPTLPQPKRMVF